VLSESIPQMVVAIVILKGSQGATSQKIDRDVTCPSSVLEISSLLNGFRFRGKAYAENLQNDSLAYFVYTVPTPFTFLAGFYIKNVSNYAGAASSQIDTPKFPSKSVKTG